MCRGPIKIVQFFLDYSEHYNFSFWIMITVLQHKYGLGKHCRNGSPLEFDFWNKPWDKLSFLMFFLSTIFSCLWRIFFHSVILCLSTTCYISPKLLLPACLPLQFIPSSHTGPYSIRLMTSWVTKRWNYGPLKRWTAPKKCFLNGKPSRQEIWLRFHFHIHFN